MLKSNIIFSNQYDNTFKCKLNILQVKLTIPKITVYRN